mmetsp:Transcript_6808/g.17115  ORF Transcript_6808/g.17115 Transcript_6808/m.17115 type:complete len:393 (-) Transcript_6808:464-1642(-)
MRKRGCNFECASSGGVANGVAHSGEGCDCSPPNPPKLSSSSSSHIALPFLSLFPFPPFSFSGWCLLFCSPSTSLWRLGWGREAWGGRPCLSFLPCLCSSPLSAPFCLAFACLYSSSLRLSSSLLLLSFSSSFSLANLIASSIRLCPSSSSTISSSRLFLCSSKSRFKAAACCLLFSSFFAISSSSLLLFSSSLASAAAFFAARCILASCLVAIFVMGAGMVDTTPLPTPFFFFFPPPPPSPPSPFPPFSFSTFSSSFTAAPIHTSKSSNTTSNAGCTLPFAAPTYLLLFSATKSFFLFAYDVCLLFCIDPSTRLRGGGGEGLFPFSFSCPRCIPFSTHCSLSSSRLPSSCPPLSFACNVGAALPMPFTFSALPLPSTPFTSGTKEGGRTGLE